MKPGRHRRHRHTSRPCAGRVGRDPPSKAEGAAAAARNSAQVRDLYAKHATTNYEHIAAEFNAVAYKFATASRA